MPMLSQLINYELQTSKLDAVELARNELYNNNFYPKFLVKQSYNVF